MRWMTWAVVAVCWSVRVCRSDEPMVPQPPPRVPAFAGQSLPQPPQQGMPWTVPATTLPEPLVSTTTFLFEHGCADPRGCEYRVISVPVGDVWGGDRGAALIKTHGWVLPGEGKERFAVCWNGLVYPAIEVGEVASLAGILPQKANNYGMHTAVPESQFVAAGGVRYLHVCQLLRLGEVELAQKYWVLLNGIEDRSHEVDPFMMVASEWLWAGFDRAVCAHMRGDHRLSLLTAEPLVRFRSDYEAEAKRRGFPRRRHPDDRAKDVFEFLSPLDSLLADQRRRVDAFQVERVLESTPETYADQAARVTALIRDLEEVSARQWGQPGGVNLVDSPIINALIVEGQAAVEPLIECYETDERLTRSVSFGRDFHTGRNLIPVYKAALVALGGILETRQFDSSVAVEERVRMSEKEYRTRIAANIRKLWEATGQLSREERWFRVLADDQATRQQWVEAAYSITMPADVSTDGFWVTTPSRKNGVVPPMKGESLRSHENPSVAELLARRSDQITKSPKAHENSTARLYEYEAAAKMAIFLAKWDAKSSLPTLSRRMDDCFREMASTQIQTDAVNHLAPELSRLTQESLAAGDSSKLEQYYQWLEKTPVDMLLDIPRDEEKLFAPFWLKPDLPESQEYAERMFNGTSSPWNPLDRVKTRGLLEPENLVISPMLSVPAFRKQVLRNLSNVDHAGTVSLKDNTLLIQTGTRSRGVGQLDLKDPDLPKPGERREFRKSDDYASKLSQLHGAPCFQLYWPLKKRDEGLTRMRQFVEDWGARYSSPVPAHAAIYEPFREKAFFSMPPLDRPATEEDVKQRRAIFSLGTLQPTRRVDIQPFPLSARWLKSQDAPRSLKTGEVEYVQIGFIWQAEEVQEGDQWKRYYGFVGRHSICKVPAEEIELNPGPPP